MLSSAIVEVEVDGLDTVDCRCCWNCCWYVGIDCKLEYKALLSKEAANSFVRSFVNAYGSLAEVGDEEAGEAQFIESIDACVFTAGLADVAR